jgi:HSP20 family protein
MPEISFFESLAEMSRLHSEINRIFKRLIEYQRLEGEGGGEEFIPELDAFENENRLVYRIELPGVEPEDIKLLLLGDTILLTGVKRERNLPQERIRFHCIERRYGKFRRLIKLEGEVDRKGAHALLEDGILTITIRKLPKPKPKEIRIEVVRK